MITVVYLPNPFKPSSRILKPFTPDEVKTLADLKEHFKIHNPADFIWAINGHHIEDSRLDTAELRAADYVAIVPKIRGGGGGGGKNVLGVVAALALVAFTGGAGGGLLGGFLGSQGGMLGLGLALYLGGSLLMGNQKTPTIDAPKYDGAFEGGPGWSVDNIRNKPGSPLPVTFGSIRTSGQLLQRRLYGGTHAGKWTQFLELLLAAGEGPLDSITDIKVNDIPIGSISGASYEVKLGTNNQTAISSVVSQIAEQLTFSSELPMSTTEWVTKAISTPGTRITLEFVAPAGIYAVVMQTGANVEVSMWIRGQYREVGASTWVAMWPYYPNGERPLASFNSRKPLYFKQDFTPPDSTKLYEFRIQNYTWKHYDDTEWHGAYPTMPDNYQVTLNWLSLTSRTNRALTFPGTAIVALSLPATENLSGGMPKVSWTQTRANIYAWNPTAGAYQQKPATNLAWMIYDIIHACRLQYNIQTSANQYVVYGEPAANIDYDTFNEWATYCGTEVEGVARCVGNLLLDSAEQMWPAIQKIATSARGFIIQQAGVFKPAWDAPKTISQIFTSGNIINGSVKGGFLSEKERATAIEASFLNEDNGFERDTLFVPSDDYNPMGLDNPTQIYFPGLTSSDVVYRACKHILRRNKYLRRTISFQADIDSIVAEIGDVVGVQSDITDWGVGGRIMGATTTKVVIDQAVSLSPEGSYTLLVRAGDGTLTRKAVDSVAEAITTTELNFTGDPWSSAPVRFELYAFGVTELETKPFTITGISRNSGLQATIEGIEYVAGVYSDDVDFPVIDYTAANAAINTLTVNTDTDTGRLMLSWSVPEDRDYGGAWVYVDGKPYGFIVADQHDITIDMPPGTYGVTVLPIDGNGRGGTAVEQEVTLGQLTVAAVSGITLTSAVRQQPDGTNLIYIGGAFTIPTLATSVLIEIGEGAEPSSWTTVQDSRVPAFSYGPVKPGTVYALRFTAKNRYAVAESVIDGLTTTGDTTPPGQPSISATSYLKNISVIIALGTVPSDLAGFQIFRHTSNNSAAATLITSVSSKDGRAEYHEVYQGDYGDTLYYWAKAFDTWGNVGEFSSAAGPLTISAIEGADIVDAALNRSELFQAGVVDAAAISAAALKQAGGAVAAWSAQNCTTASIAEAGGVIDVSGNGNHGTAIGGVDVVSSDNSAAFRFDAAGECIIVPDMTFSDYHTIAFWYRGSQSATFRALISRNGGSYYHCLISNSHNRFLGFYKPSDFVSSGYAIQDDTLYHIAIIAKASDTWSLYVNGAFVITLDGFWDASTIPLGAIGNSGVGGPQPANGVVSCPRVYPRALTATEIKTLYMFPGDVAFARVTADFMAANSVVASSIVSGAVTTPKLAAGAVTIEKLLVGSPGAALNSDPSCSDISAFTGGGSIVTLTDGIAGTTALRATSGAHIFDTKYYPLDRTKSYRLRLWARSGGSAPGNMYYRLYYGSSFVDVVAASTLTSTWTEKYGVIAGSAFPAGTMQIRIGIIFNYASAVGYHEIQDLRLEEVLPATLIQDGAITTDKINVAGLNAGVIKSGSLDAARIAAGSLNADKITSGTITADQINVEAIKAPIGAVAEWSAKGSTAASIALTAGVKDVSGNNKHGTAAGGVAIVNTVRGPAFSFDGINDQITIPTGVTATNWSISGWFSRSNSTGTYGTLIAKGTGGSVSWEVETLVSSTGVRKFYVYPSTVGVQDYSLNTLHHYTITRNSTTLTIYFDGALVGTEAHANSYPLTGALCIGAWNSGTQWFEGIATPPKIYDRVLTATEVKTLYMLGTDSESGTITADRVVTGQIKSLNYSTTAGSMIDLDAGDVKMGGSSAPRFSFTNSTNAGVFAGFTFNATDLTAGSGSTAIGISTDTAKRAFWAGSATPSSAPFQVKHDGTGVLAKFDFNSDEMTAAKTIASDVYSTTIFSNDSSTGTGVTTEVDRASGTYLYASFSGGVLYCVRSSSGSPTRTLTTDGSASVAVNANFISGASTGYGFYTNARVYAGSGYYPTSDESVKSDISDVAVLEKLRQLPVKQFFLDEEKIAIKTREKEFQRNIKEKNAVVCETPAPTKPDIEYCKQKRIGTMAADFNRIFGTNNGEAETYDLVDAIGVSLRAIQELAEIVDDLKAENAELRAALKLPEKQKKQVAVELTAEEIEKAADSHVKAAYENIMQELKK